MKKCQDLNQLTIEKYFYKMANNNHNSDEKKRKYTIKKTNKLFSIVLYLAINPEYRDLFQLKDSQITKS